MRKLKLQMQVSIDGYVCGPNGEMDWMVWDWDDELKKYVNDLTRPVDCILLGRKLAQGFIPHWESWISNPETTDDFGHKMVNTPKIVFSNTLKKSEWANTELAKNRLEDEVNRLKHQSGKDMIVYGGATLAVDLIRHKLIDELHLFVNPAALGTGMRIFNQVTHMSLTKSKMFECGINVLCYTFKKE